MDTQKALENKYRILVEKRSKLEDKLFDAERKETEMLARRGWGYGMRHSKIGFSTRISDNLKERITKCENEMEELNNKIKQELTVQLSLF